MGIAAILQLITAAEPGVISLITMIRGQNGSTTAVVYLDEADTQFAANQKQIADWFSSKGKTPPPVPAA